MELHRLRPFVRLLSALALVAVAGCATLPAPPERVATHALRDTAATTLGRIAAASLVGAAPGDSGFRLMPSGEFAFEARIALARRAEASLDVQYYQVQNDSIGLRFLGELAAAARRGVRVRLLVDDLYTGDEDALLRSMAALANVQVRLFNPLPARGGSPAMRIFWSLHEFTRINHRMHNKLFIADTRFSISGGRNMADEYFMRSAEANFIDLDVLAAGPVVREQSKVFDLYWNSPFAWPIESVAAAPAEAAPGSTFEALVQGATPHVELPALDPLEQPALGVELTGGRATLAFAPAEVFADAPAKVVRDSHDENVSTVARSTLEAIQAARKEVLVASPYFIPGPVGMAMIEQARAHGIRIAIFTNALGATDEPLVHWRYARYRRALLKLGVEIYELSPELARDAGSFGNFRKSFGRLHAKVALIDGRQLFVGSLNLDQRSAWSNTESGLLIDSPALAGEIGKLIGHDRLASVYALRLAADRESIEWVATGADGKQVVTRTEPHDSWLHRLKMQLLGPFAPEELL
jgi:putative cardiolipin synthase